MRAERDFDDELKELHYLQGAQLWDSKISKHCIRGVASFARSGGAKLKLGGQGFHQNAKAFSGRNHKFSDQTQVISKKKVFAEIRRLFLAKIANFNVFFRTKTPTSSSQKNTVGGQEENRGGKNENRGGIAPPAPPLATRLHSIERFQLRWFGQVSTKQNASEKTPKTSFTCQSKWKKISRTT